MGAIKIPTDTSTTQAKKGIQQIISRAIKSDVSAIHIEPMSRSVVVRYRRGGMLYQATTLPKSAAERIAKHFKDLAQLDINQTRSPQNGQYVHRLGRKTYLVQVATLPIIDGEKLTLTLSSSNSTAENLQNLGLWGRSLAMAQQSLTQPSGLIIIAGQRQAESMLVQAAMLQQLARASLPVALIGSGDEPDILGIKKVKIHPDAGWGYSRYLKVLAKQGFSVIGLSAVINKRTAQTATQIAEQGAVVMPVIHAGSAIKGMLYLHQASHQLSSIVLTRAIVGNVFVRGLCLHCCEAYWPSIDEQRSMRANFKISSKEVIRQLADLEQQARDSGIAPDNEPSINSDTINRLWRPHPLGCKFCDNTGYGSRIGLLEVCLPSTSLLNAISSQKSIAELQALAVKAGMISLKVDGFIKALRGVIDYATLMKVCEAYDR